MAKHRAGRQPPWLTGLTAAALVAAVGAAGAQSTAPDTAASSAKKTTTKQDTARVSQGAPGLTIARDATTGALRAPTDEEAAALAPAAPASPAAIVEFVTPTGAIAARVPEDMMTYTVVTKNADGTLDEVCLPDRQSAEAAVRSAARAPQAASVTRSRNALRPAPGAPNE